MLASNLWHELQPVHDPEINVEIRKSMSKSKYHTPYGAASNSLCLLTWFVYVVLLSCVYATCMRILSYVLEVTKQQMCIKYCSSGLYYQLQGSCGNVCHCVNLWVTSTTRPLSYFQQICCTSQTGQHEPLLEVTKQQICMKYCSSGLLRPGLMLSCLGHATM